MAIITRRYRWDGPDLTVLQSLTDPGTTLAQAFETWVDVTFDDAIADIASVNSAMARWGFVFDAAITEVLVDGKLNVTGALDPTSVRISDPLAGTALYYESAPGQTAPVSAVGEGRIRYNGTTNKWQISENAGAYVDIGTATIGGGWQDDGTVVRLITLTDTVSIGTSTMASNEKLRVHCDVTGGAAIHISATVGGNQTIRFAKERLSTIFTEDSTTVGAAGGTLTLAGAAGGDAGGGSPGGTGATVAVTAGVGGASDGVDAAGTGGGVSLEAGQAGGSSGGIGGDGGFILIAAGNATGNGQTGGAVDISAGSGGGNGSSGGTITIVAGAGTGTGTSPSVGDGGDVFVQAGNSVGSAKVGGIVDLRAGNGAAATAAAVGGVGGTATVIAGNGGARHAGSGNNPGAGGLATLQGGTAGTGAAGDSAAGGAARVQAGNGSGDTGAGGEVQVRPGVGAGGGAAGVMRVSNSSNNATADVLPRVDAEGNIGTAATRWALVRAVTITSGDYAWEDEACAACGGEFNVQDEVVLRVRRVENDSEGRRVSYAVPVHRSCPT